MKTDGAQQANQNTEKCTCNRRQARENGRLQAMVGFASDWLRKWEKFTNQSQSEGKQNQSKRELLSTFNWKPLQFGASQ